MEISSPIKCTKKLAGVAKLISNKIDFNLKSIRRDRDGLFIHISETIHHEKSIPSFIFLYIWSLSIRVVSILLEECLSEVKKIIPLQSLNLTLSQWFKLWKSHFVRITYDFSVSMVGSCRQKKVHFWFPGIRIA